MGHGETKHQLRSAAPPPSRHHTVSKKARFRPETIYKNGDDIAVSIGRSFERLEERIDSAEARIYGRLADLEDQIKMRIDDTV